MTDQDYKSIFRKYSRGDLQLLWQALIDTDVPFSEATLLSDDVEYWDKGKAFEYLIMRLFELEGAEVEYAYEVKGNYPKSDGHALEQIDGLFYYKQYVGLVECKNWKDRVSNETIATLRSQLMRRPSSIIGNVFSISGFTEPAITLATHLHPQTILLWNQQDIQHVMNNGSIVEGSITKFKQYATRCVPDYRL